MKTTGPGPKGPDPSSTAVTVPETPQCTGTPLSPAGCPTRWPDFYFIPRLYGGEKGGSGALPQRDAQPVGLPFLDGKRGGERLVFLGRRDDNTAR